MEIAAQVKVIPINNEEMLYDSRYDYVITDIIDYVGYDINCLKFSLIIIGRN